MITTISAQIEGMEWVIVLIIVAVLLFFAPKYLGPLFRSAGKATGEFQKGRLEVQKEIEEIRSHR